MGKKILLSAILLISLGSVPAFSAGGFDAIKPADPLAEEPVFNTNQGIQLSIPKKATLTKNDVHNHYAIALERFIQCNVKSSYADFKMLIETIVPNDYAYMKMAMNMADLGFFNLSELALSKVSDDSISNVLQDDIKHFYFPVFKLQPKDEVYLAEMFSNIIYNDQCREAVAEMLKNQQLLSNSDYANYLVALGSLKANNIDDAQKYINNAIEKNPQNLNYKKLKAEIMLQSKKPKNALKIVEDIKQQPLLSKEFINKVNSLEQYVLYKTVKQDPEKKYHLAYYYYYEGELTKAIRTLQGAVTQKKKYNKDVYALTAKVYYDMKEYEKAESFAMKSKKLDSSNIMALMVLGDISYRKGDYKTALGYYEKAASKEKKSTEPEIKTAQTCEHLGKTKQANEIYTKILKERSDCAMAYYNVGLNDKSRETEYLKKAVSLNIDFVDGWIALSKLAIDKQNYTAAKHYLAIAKYIDENDFRYYYYQGLVCKAQGLIQDAVYNFRKSLSINPDFKPAKEELSI
ncbi:tPR repeat [Brachyspira sp. CAG:484]|nr:tPR repeat [Brachyspira sp. CAG:484]